MLPFTQVGLSGDVLTINGMQFGSNPSQIMVKIGAVICPVITANDSYITCTVGSNPVGRYDVTVGIIGVGLASGKGSFVYRLVTSSISPIAGSVGGGEAIHITGSGFNPFGPLDQIGASQYWNNFTIQPNVTIAVPQAQSILNSSVALPMYVLVGQELCAISVATYTSITCYIRAFPHQPGLANVTVVVGDQQATAPVPFQFSFDHTPTVSQVQPAQGSVLGGTSVTISGANLFGDVQVRIGSSMCAVVNVSEGKVSCLTAPLAPGIYPIFVSVNDSGLAVPDNASVASPLTFKYLLEINGVSPPLSSVLGGQLVSIGGRGFGTGANTVVTVGGRPCNVVSVTSDEIHCTTPTSVSTHVINFLPSQAGK